MRRPGRANLPRCLSDRQLQALSFARGLLRLLTSALVGLVLATTVLSTPTVAQHDPFQSLSDDAAQELVELLERVEAAEAAENWVVGVRLYREMWQILPVEEYQFGEAFCLELLGDNLGAIEVLEALVRSPREEVRDAAQRQLEPLQLAAAMTSATAAVASAQRQGALTAAAAPETPPPTTVEPQEREIWPPILLGSLAVVAVGSGVAFGVLSEQREQDARDYDASQPGATYLAVEQLNDDAESFATVANVSFGVAGALAVSAVLVWLLTEPDEDDGSVEITAAPSWVDGHPGAVIQWQF